MKKITKGWASLTLGCCLASSLAQASVIKSMTIEEIGTISGGLGTSSVADVGGEFSAAGVASGSGFTSLGSLDGAIVMGQTQGTNAFTRGFTAFGILALPHTLNGAPTGSIRGGTMTLDLSGWGAWWSGLHFALFPDEGTLLTSILQLTPNQYYYTADWSHIITAAEHAAFAGIPTNWHLEGIATTVAEPGTFWLIGATLMGVLGVRRRNFL